MNFDAKNRLKLFMISMAFLTSASGFASVRVGNGTTGLKVDGKNVAIDLLERGSMFEVHKQPAYNAFVKPRLEDLTTILPETGRFLTSIFESRENSLNGNLTPRWYHVSLPLVTTDDVGASPVVVSGYESVQIALNTGTEIFIQLPTLKDWSDRDIGFLYLHEALISSFGYEKPLADTAVIRSLAGRLMEPSIYKDSPRIVAKELLGVLKAHSTSTLYAALMRDITAQPAGEATRADLNGFIAECTSRRLQPQTLRTFQMMLSVYRKTGLHSDEETTLRSEVASAERAVESARKDVDRARHVRQLNCEECQIVGNCTSTSCDIDRTPSQDRALENEQQKLRKATNKLNALFTLDENVCRDVFRYYWAQSEISLIGQGISEAAPLRYFGEVERLILTSNQISSTQGISELRNLRYLNLGRNRIQDITAFSRLTRLTDLLLPENDLSTVDGLDLPSLHHLDLSKNLLARSTGKVKLPELRELVLRDNQLKSEDLTFLSPANMPKLRSVYLEGNRISDLLFVGAQWELLFIDRNKINSLQGLKIDGPLRNLSIGGNPLENIQGSDLPKSLEILGLDGETAIETLSVDQTWPALETLSLQDSSINFYKFTDKRRNLRYLNLAENVIFDFSIIKDSIYFKDLFYLNVSRRSLPHPIDRFKNLWHLFELRKIWVAREQNIDELKQTVFSRLIQPHPSYVEPGATVRLEIIGYNVK